VRQVGALPGLGGQKAKILVALLGKQFGVAPPRWREACEPFGEEGSQRSVADITSPETRIQVRDSKKATKAEAKCRLRPAHSRLVGGRDGPGRRGGEGDRPR
jgi:uncharacterized HhH-GPD family protein